MSEPSAQPKYVLRLGSILFVPLCLGGRSRCRWFYAAGSDLGAEVWKATMSPICVRVVAMTPTGSSIVLTPRQDQAMPHGFTLRLRPTTRFFLSRKTTSIGKRMNHMWIDEHGSMSRPVSGFSPLLPSSPLERAENDVAISSSVASATPRAMLIAAQFG